MIRLVSALAVVVAAWGVGFWIDNPAVGVLLTGLGLFVIACLDS